jgi:predicted component of type VI protein secretion system
MTMTLTAPTVPQVTPGVEDAVRIQTTDELHGPTPINVSATLAEDGIVTLALDRGTASAVLNLVSEQATEAEARVRRTQASEHPKDPSDREQVLAYLALNAHRLRTVGDAYAAERARIYGPAVTYDHD